MAGNLLRWLQLTSWGPESEHHAAGAGMQLHRCTSKEGNRGILSSAFSTFPLLFIRSSNRSSSFLWPQAPPKVYTEALVDWFIKKHLWENNEPRYPESFWKTSIPKTCLCTYMPLVMAVAVPSFILWPLLVYQPLTRAFYIVLLSFPYQLKRQFN